VITGAGRSVAPPPAYTGGDLRIRDAGLDKGDLKAATRVEQVMEAREASR